MDSRAICVLTTSERVDLFRAAVGVEADFWLNPLKTGALDDFLHNLQMSGGQVVILDEEHFVTIDVMCSGLQRFLDDPAVSQGRLRIIVVSSRRRAGNPLLSFLVTYCGIYDVLYGVDGPEMSACLRGLIERPNRRVDVLELIAGSAGDGVIWESNPWGGGQAEVVIPPGQGTLLKFSIRIQPIS